MQVPVRPWQHVLEPLRAYLTLGGHLLSGDRSKTGSWNVGPTPDGEVTVVELVRAIVETWGLDIEIGTDGVKGPPESQYLRLDTTKLRTEVVFEPHFRFQDTVDFVVDGYRRWLSGEPLTSVIKSQTEAYMEFG